MNVLDVIAGLGIGDFASVAGLIVSLWTLWLVRRTRAMAQRIASNALRTDAISEISAVTAALEEVKRLIRKGTWELVPERWTAAKRTLLALIGNSHLLVEGDREVLEKIIRGIGGMQKKTERILGGEVPQESNTKSIDAIDAHLDALYVVLAHLKTKSREAES